MKTIKSYDVSFAIGAPKQQIQELASLSAMRVILRNPLYSGWMRWDVSVRT